MRAGRGRTGSINLQVGKVTIRIAPGPTGDLAANLSEFQIVYNEARLTSALDVELRLHARDDDAKPGPYANLKIGIGFVERRRLGARAFEREIGHGDVLKCVIAAGLIIGASVGHTQ